MNCHVSACRHKRYSFLAVHGRLPKKGLTVSFSLLMMAAPPRRRYPKAAAPCSASLAPRPTPHLLLVCTRENVVKKNDKNIYALVIYLKQRGSLSTPPQSLCARRRDCCFAQAAGAPRARLARTLPVPARSNQARSAVGFIQYIPPVRAFKHHRPTARPRTPRSTPRIRCPSTRSSSKPGPEYCQLQRALRGHAHLNSVARKPRGQRASRGNVASSTRSSKRPRRSPPPFELAVRIPSLLMTHAKKFHRPCSIVKISSRRRQGDARSYQTVAQANKRAAAQLQSRR